MSPSQRKHEASNGDARHVDFMPALRAAAKTAGQIRRVDEDLIERVRERPIVATAIAMAVGYLIGRAFSRWG